MACFLGLGAIMGHQFPVWLSFKGGKGAATGIGVLFALNWQAAAVAMGVFFLVLALTRIVSASSILACVAVPIAHALLPGRYALPEQRWIVLVFLAAMCGVIVVLHKTNIKRILNGTERKLGQNDVEAAPGR
jgi:glycerol-3-phosphate acyltransferase PlsY